MNIKLFYSVVFITILSFLNTPALCQTSRANQQNSNEAMLGKLDQYFRQGSRLTADQAQIIERNVENLPRDISERIQLIGFYVRNQKEVKEYDRARHRHMTWLVSNHPDLDFLSTGYAKVSYLPTGLANSRSNIAKLWDRILQQDPDNLKLLENSASFYLNYNRNQAVDRLLKAQALDPSNAKWPSMLGDIYASGMEDPSRYFGHDAAQNAYLHFQQALDLVIDESRDYKQLIRKLAKSAFASNKLAEATQYGEALLAFGHRELNGYEQELDQFRRRNTHSIPPLNQDALMIHTGYTVLGRAALKNREISKAKEYLIKSVDVSGSNALFVGPSMALAQDLLDKGEKEIVLEYFDACSEVWQSGKTLIDRWKITVAADKQPDFGIYLSGI